MTATKKRRTQQERRDETQAKLLASACQLFGERGFAKVSLEEIAAHCGLTIGPIYHHYRNKETLFAAVNEEVERRILKEWESCLTISGLEGVLARWRSFLDLCMDPGFRQIVLVDSPNILGRQRWNNSQVALKARDHFIEGYGEKFLNDTRGALLWRLSMGVFSEAALVIAEAEDSDIARQQTDELVSAFIKALFDATS